MRHFDSWHFLRSLKSHMHPASACHCGVPCMCTWGLLSVMSLAGCNENAGPKHYAAEYLGIMLDNYYVPAAGISLNCLEEDNPPPNCH